MTMIIDELPDELLHIDNILTTGEESSEDTFDLVSPVDIDDSVYLTTGESQQTAESSRVDGQQKMVKTGGDFYDGYTVTLPDMSCYDVTAVATLPTTSDPDVVRGCYGDGDDSSHYSEHSADMAFEDRNNNDMEPKQVASDVDVGRFRPLPRRLSTRRIEIIDNDSDDDIEHRAVYNSRRKKSSDDDDEVTSSRHSAYSELNKNALNARLNRQKKKAYIESLESKQSQLSSENVRLKSAVTCLASERDRLADEVDYLKAVLANDSALSELIRKIDGTSGVRFASRFESGVKRKWQQSVESDHDYIPASKLRVDTSSRRGGVCLHVRQSRMSLEFCDRCSEMSGDAV